MQRPSQVPNQNRLLASLPRLDYQRLALHLEPVSLTFGQVLHEADKPIQHVYFPYSGVVSLLTVVDSSKATEVAVVGSEGVIGGSAALGVNISFFRAVVQAPGSAVRITAARMHKEFKTHGSLNPQLLQFNYALMNQIAQTAACNRFHKVEARLARWLLSIRDRVHSNHFHVTQEFLSLMLGVRRVGVTTAAANFQKLGLITYSRGNIELLNPKGLQAATCECYGIVKKIDQPA